MSSPLVNQTVAKSIEDGLAPGAEKTADAVPVREMMEAVRDGKADAAFVYYYIWRRRLSTVTRQAP